MDNLKVIYQLYLAEILRNNSIANDNRTESLASMMVDFYAELITHFTEVAHPHYLFSPHEITKWCYSLLRYKHLINESFDEALLEAVCYEAKRIFGDKLVDQTDVLKFNEILRQHLARIWSNDLSIVKEIDSVYFIPEDGLLETVPCWGTNLIKYNENDWKKFVDRAIIQYGTIKPWDILYTR